MSLFVNLFHISSTASIKFWYVWKWKNKRTNYKDSIKAKVSDYKYFRWKNEVFSNFFKFFSHDWKTWKYYPRNWSPRRYCKYAVTNKPKRVTGINPKTIPDNNGSTMFFLRIFMLQMNLIIQQELKVQTMYLHQKKQMNVMLPIL